MMSKFLLSQFDPKHNKRIKKIGYEITHMNLHMKLL